MKLFSLLIFLGLGSFANADQSCKPYEAYGPIVTGTEFVLAKDVTVDSKTGQGSILAQFRKLSLDKKVNGSVQEIAVPFVVLNFDEVFNSKFASDGVGLVFRTGSVFRYTPVKDKHPSGLHERFLFANTFSTSDGKIQIAFDADPSMMSYILSYMLKANSLTSVCAPNG